MEKFPKKFIRASLIYLILGVVLGVLLSIVDFHPLQMRFIHVHIMLLGFMAMAIYGVAYHILPRFNAQPVPFPGLIPTHFWFVNIGLWGMVSTYAMGAYWTEGPLRWAFIFFALLEGAGILIFAVNIYGCLKDEPEEVIQEETKPAEPASPPVKLDPSMSIFDILEKYPHLEEGFAEVGLGDVANEAARETVGKMVTLKMSAQRVGKDLGELMALLEGKKLLTDDDDTANENAPAHPPGYLATGKGIARGELAVVKTQIGNLLEVYPETKPVFETNYGSECFTCPGQKTETIEQTAAMHSMPPQKILDEINSIIETVIKK